MINRTIVFVSCLIATMILSLPAIAHEYWLQPIRFFVQNNDVISAHIHVGQHFKGDKYPYISKDITSMGIHLGSASKTIVPRTGDYPAITEAVLGDGINILTVTTNPSVLIYDEPGKFEKFLLKEGLNWVLAEHENRKLPAIGFTETYRRNAKTLIKVGSGEGADQKTGLEFEWVLQTNPYTATKNELVAQLLWQGKVFADKQFRVFIRTGDELITHVSNTNKDGMAHFPFYPDAKYLVNAVHMILPTNEVVEKYNAVWESRWASLTFATE